MSFPRAYCWAFSLVALALPFSNAMMSIATGLLGAVWLADCAMRRGRDSRASSPTLNRSLNWVSVGLIALYVLHTIGMAWSEDWTYGLHDLRAKLPMLALGLAGLAVPPMVRKDRDRALKVFLFAVMAALLGLFLNAAFFAESFGQGRAVSVYISHVRFGMMLAFSVVVARYFSHAQTKTRCWWLAVLAAVLGGLWWMQAVTGFVMLAVLAPWWALPSGWSQRRRFRTAWTTGAVVILAAVILLKVGMSAAGEPLHAEDLPTHSAAGELYEHVDGSFIQENGHFVWASVAWGELAYAWNQRSTRAFNGKNLRGQSLSGTLIRFLASKDQPKDAEGVASLSSVEIAAIERGVPSTVELHGSGLVVRWNRLQFALGRWRDGQGVQGSSALQRIEHLRAAWAVVSAHPIGGVGTGDVPSATAAAYEQINSALEPAFRHRAHNQYLALWEAFGLLGLFALLGWLALGMYQGLREGSAGLLLPFIAMVAMAFLTEDTLETQSGVTLVAWGAVLLSGWRAD